MEQTLINHPKLKVRQRTGREGPSYDPYGYDEYTIQTPTGSYLVHLGLGVFVKYGKLRIDARGKDYDNAVNWASEHVKQMTGYTLPQLWRIHHQVSTRCPKGGYHWGDTADGYPGESFCVCEKCGKMYDYTFDESAVI